MSAAISNQWWAAEGLLTGRAKDVRTEIGTREHADAHLQRQTSRNKQGGAEQEEEAARWRRE